MCLSVETLETRKLQLAKWCHFFWCDFPCVHRQKCEGWDCPVKGMAQPPVVHYALRSWFLRWKSTWAQWEFQDPKMEVLYHILGHMNCGDIPWNLGLMVGTSNLGSWNGHWSATPPNNFNALLYGCISIRPSAAWILVASRARGTWNGWAFSQFPTPTENARRSVAKAGSGVKMVMEVEVIRIYIYTLLNIIYIYLCVKWTSCCVVQLIKTDDVIQVLCHPVEAIVQKCPTYRLLSLKFGLLQR
jgi:hypothetical protein